MWLILYWGKTAHWHTHFPSRSSLFVQHSSLKSRAYSKLICFRHCSCSLLDKDDASTHLREWSSVLGTLCGMRMNPINGTNLHFSSILPRQLESQRLPFSSLWEYCSDHFFIKERNLHLSRGWLFYLKSTQPLLFYAIFSNHSYCSWTSISPNCVLIQTLWFRPHPSIYKQ